MKRSSDETNTPGWLMFFHSVPTKPVANRMKVWRKLVKAGALPFKGAVYLLPYSDEHYEFLQWLVSEVETMGGEAAFVRAGKVETVADVELVRLFSIRVEETYNAVQNELHVLETRLAALDKSSGIPVGGHFADSLSRVTRMFEDTAKTDFFSSAAGRDVKKRIACLKAGIQALSGAGAAAGAAGIVRRKVESFRGRLWVTRKRPFVDRMASAWLVRRFIDSGAVFGFMDEAGEIEEGAVTFDVKDGEFTHVGGLCTFEVMVRSFGLKGKSLKKVAEVVHDLDVKDGMYNSPEADGVEDILSGIRKTAADDTVALEKGMAVFEMLYAAKG